MLGHISRSYQGRLSPQNCSYLEKYSYLDQYGELQRTSRLKRKGIVLLEQSFQFRNAGFDRFSWKLK